MKLYFKNNYQILQTLSKPAKGIEVDYNQIKYGSPTDTETKDLILVNGKVCVVFSNNLTEDIKKILASVLTENKCKVVNSTSTRFDEKHIENFAGNIQELPEYTDGLSAGTFRRDGKVFEIIEVIEEYTHLEYVYDINNAKEEKINQLKEAFENNKLYIIENGETLIIDNNSKTPDGNNAKDLFNNILEGALNMPTSQNDTSVKFYQQQVGKDVFKISGVNTIWQYLLKDLFYFTQNGLLYRIREHNKCLYDEKLNKIKNAVTLDELNAITWNFIPHPKINVNQVANNLLQDNTIAESVKALIRLRETPVGSGNYKLIEKL